MTSSVTILGAGPAGLTAAITCARAGHSVDVYEQHSDVAFRFAGDLHGIENWTERHDLTDTFEMISIERNFDCQPCERLELTDGRRIVTVPCDEPLFYLVRRGSEPGCLDAGLKDQALELGVRIHFGQRRQSCECDIVATGPQHQNTFAIEKGILFETDADDLAVGLADAEITGFGYAYLLINNGQGCLCAVLFDDFPAINARLEASSAALQALYEFDITNPTPIGGVGAVSLSSLRALDEVRIAGEAAGIQDPLFGFGIRNVMVSGHLAATSLLQGSSYADACRERFVGPIEAGLINRYLWRGLVTRELFYPSARVFARSRQRLAMLRRGHQLSALHRILRRFADVQSVQSAAR